MNVKCLAYMFTILGIRIKILPPLSPMTIPQGEHMFSSDHQSYALSGGVSTWMDDCLGIPRVVGFSFLLVFEQFFPHFCCLTPCWNVSQSGMPRTVAVYLSPKGPIELIISDLPFSDSMRDFQRLSRFSSLFTQSIQLAC